MRSLVFVACSVFVITSTAQQVAGQTPRSHPQASTDQTVSVGPPRLVAMNGTLVDASGQPLAGTAMLTFALYADQEGGAPLWTETQTVTADARGRYTVWLGSQTPLPVDQFQTTEARWLGVRAAGGGEAARLRLVSVPYALKAGDAETLGGLPAAAYLRAPASATPGQAAASGRAQTSPTVTSGADPTGTASFEDSGPPGNTAFGYQALVNLTTGGSWNSAFGYFALAANTIGFQNTAAGVNALAKNTTGGSNTATGFLALQNNTSGGENTAMGSSALASNSTGLFNSAAGGEALSSNTTGHRNTAVGGAALQMNKTGDDNTAAGIYALGLNTTGVRNVALGQSAGYWATGSDNVYIANGGTAGENGAIYLGTAGTHTKTVLAGNIGVGTSTPSHRLDVRGTGATYASVSALSSGNAGVIFNNGQGGSAVIRSNETDHSITMETPIGAEHLRVTPDGRVGINTPAPPHALSITSAVSSYVNLISLGGNAGHIFTAGGREAVIRLNIADGSFVWENPNGTERMRITAAGNVGIGTADPTHPLQMGSGAFVSPGGVWTNASSRALKHDIADLPADRARDAVAQLRPVTFAYNAEPDRTHVGFIAEDVPGLVSSPDRRSLAAMDLVAVAIKVLQAQQATIEEQRATIDELTARLTKLEAIVTALTGSRDGGGDRRK